jgi:hypothetical protein
VNTQLSGTIKGALFLYRLSDHWLLKNSALHAAVNVSFKVRRAVTTTETSVLAMANTTTAEVVKLRSVSCNGGSRRRE